MKIQGRIARSGDPDLRALLYMFAVIAIRYNQACKAFYLHLKEKGKASKLALVALANKTNYFGRYLLSSGKTPGLYRWVRG